MYLALKKCKNECKIFKITLVQIFVHLSLKLLDFLSDFVLKPGGASYEEVVLTGR